MPAVPAEMPATVPPELIVATVGSLLTQVPPAVASVNEVVVPAHTTELPAIGATAKEANDSNNAIAVMIEFLFINFQFLG